MSVIYRCKIEFWLLWISTHEVFILRTVLKMQRNCHVEECQPHETGCYCITTLPTDKIWTRRWIMTLRVHFYCYAGILALFIHLFLPRLHIFAIFQKKGVSTGWIITNLQFHIELIPQFKIPLWIVTPCHNSILNCGACSESTQVISPRWIVTWVILQQGIMTFLHIFP